MEHKSPYSTTGQHLENHIADATNGTFGFIIYYRGQARF